ncbi:MAG: hypothetical protein JNL62_01935 [Bryobacterales bacterium]|nr:hypothetical protein [Bryobacterales bacterium]
MTRSTVRCPYCRKPFEPSAYQRSQRVCGQPACQKQRRADYHRQKRENDPAYAETCRNSQAKWRQAHPDYQRQYREQHPDSAARNRARQPHRDRKRRLRHALLEKNTSAFDLKPAVSAVWLVGPAAADLEKNTLASTEVFLLQSLPRASPPPPTP